MKKILITLAIAFTFTVANSQTAEVHLKNGITKHNQQDYKGAIKDYDKAIKEDKTIKVAYFNRGICELALKDFKAAMADFDKTIALDPEYKEAYYSRATIYVSQQKYKEALPDLNKVIALDQTTPNALTLRGQILAQTGDKKAACKDFQMAKENGDKQADQYLRQFCGNEKSGPESMMLDWPEAEHWKIGSNQETDQMVLVELIHADETLEKWTEFATMMSLKGIKNVPMDQAMNMMFNQAKKNGPKATLTFIEKDETAEHPWIIFKIETPRFNNDSNPESQLWYVVQGREALYTNFWAVKKPTITESQKDKWVTFFKTGKVVNQ